MRQSLFATTLGVALTASVSFAFQASADDAQVARGRFLVTIAGCSDCHTPGVFGGENLTPDKETGLGSWTDEQIIAAIRTGKTPEGRELSPVMPYPALSHLSDVDAQAVVAFLKSLPPVSNKVKNFGPDDKVTINVSAVLPPNVYNALPAPKK